MIDGQALRLFERHIGDGSDHHSGDGLRLPGHSQRIR
jgi:hypothetical protein